MENKQALPEVSEEEQLIEQARIRREKLAKLVGEGKNPYEQVKYPVDADSASIKADYEKYEGQTVCLAGRMMSRRIMGKASFSHIADKSGSIQIYVTRQDIGEENYLSYKKDYDIDRARKRNDYAFQVPFAVARKVQRASKPRYEVSSSSLGFDYERRSKKDFPHPFSYLKGNSRVLRRSRIFRSGHAHLIAFGNRRGRSSFQNAPQRA